MDRRDVALLGFRLIAAWLVISGAVASVSSLLTWPFGADELARHTAALGLAASALYIPIGAIAWMASESLAIRLFQPTAPGATAGLSRGDLYAAMSVGVGLYLLADALPQVVYWVVVWRAARGTSFWSEAGPWRGSDTVVYAVSARGQVGALLTKIVLGLACIAGQARVEQVVTRLRGELSSHILPEPEAEQSEPEKRE